MRRRSRRSRSDRPLPARRSEPTIAALAELLHVPALPLDTSRGTTQPFALAFIDEATCIGCTLCIQVCPTDAIVGAAKQMHTVLADRCTGCELCLPPCPVDCIAMVPAGRDWTVADADRARERYDARRMRALARKSSVTLARTDRARPAARSRERKARRRAPRWPAVRARDAGGASR